MARSSSTTYIPNSMLKALHIIGTATFILILLMVIVHTFDLNKISRTNGYGINKSILSIQQSKDLKPELKIISYRSWNRCVKKMQMNCGEILQNYCNCVRVNSLMNISINYLGDDDNDEYNHGHIKKIINTHKYLKYHLSSRYTINEQKYSIVIMFVDAFDSLFQRSSNIILQKFLKLTNRSENKNKVVFQVEKGCSPGHPRNLDRTILCDTKLDAYPQEPEGSEARYLNAGGWIGYLYDVIELFQQFMDFIDITGGHDSMGKWRGDQEIISMHYINRSRLMTLDFYAFIMQSMHHNVGKIKLTDQGYYNPKVRNYPTLLHFNGGNNGLNAAASDIVTAMVRNNPNITDERFRNGKINGNFEIQLTSFNVSRKVKYSQICGKFKQWYY